MMKTGSVGNVTRSASMGEMPVLVKKPAFVFLEPHGKEHLSNKAVPMPADELFLRLKRKTQKWRVKKSGAIEGLQKKNPCPIEHAVLPTEIDGWLLTLRSPSDKPQKVNLAYQPPSFFNEDIDHWRNKFQKTIEERQKFKEFVKKKYWSDVNFNGRSTTSLRDTLKSRRSSPTFTTMDIDYKGNTAEIEHLVTKQNGDLAHNRCQIDFEGGLRNYESPKGSRFIAKPWKLTDPYMKTEDGGFGQKTKPINLTTRVDFSKNAMNDGPYLAKFKDGNANTLKHSFKNPGFIIGSLQWESALRDQEHKKGSSPVEEGTGTITKYYTKKGVTK